MPIIIITLTMTASRKVLSALPSFVYFSVVVFLFLSLFFFLLKIHRTRKGGERVITEQMSFPPACWTARLAPFTSGSRTEFLKHTHTDTHTKDVNRKVAYIWRLQLLCVMSLKVIRHVHEYIFAYENILSSFLLFLLFHCQEFLFFFSFISSRKNIFNDIHQ